MERYTYVTEKGDILFHPEDLPDDEGMTITQLAEDGRFKALEIIAESLANHEQAAEMGVYGKWIPVSKRLPEEYDSIFKKFKGTDKWNARMYERSSKMVIATIEYRNGEMRVQSAKTIEGKWNIDTGVVIAWMPLPEPYRESEVQ